MIWVTWRQHRTELLVMIAILFLTIPILVATGQRLAYVLEIGGPSELSSLIDGMSVFFDVFTLLLPLLLGMFVGAPLISRDFEQGTYRLAWTQGISRQSWLRSKVLLAFVVSLACFAALTLVFWWWNQPVNSAISPFSTFNVNGVVMIASTAFALALGICLGVMFGKPIPAMALTLPVFWVVRLLVNALIQIYPSPLTVNWDWTGTSPIFTYPINRGWVVDSTLLDSLGKPVAWQQAFDACGNTIGLGSGGPDGMRACFQSNHWIQQIAYQPFERFWFFQGIESAILLALATGLVALTFWWVRKKLS